MVLMLLIFSGCVGSNLNQKNNEPVARELKEADLFGLSLTKIVSWEFITAEEFRDSISETKLEDENIEKLVMLFMSRPIVSIVKDRLKIPLPAVTITVNPKEGSPDVSVTSILKRFAEIGPGGFKDYTVVVQPQEMEIDGHKAAYMKAHYTGQFYDDNKLYPVSYETWIILRQGYFFNIGAVSSQNEDDKTREEIASVIKSIKLRK